MTTVLIKSSLEKDVRDRVGSLLVGFQSAGLAQFERALIVTTEDEHVAALLEPYAEPFEPFHTGGKSGGEAVRKHENGTGREPVAVGVKEAVQKVKEVAGGDSDPGDKGEEEITYTDFATKEVHSLGAMRQMLRFGRVEKGQQFVHSRKGLLEVYIGPGYKLKLRKVEA